MSSSVDILSALVAPVTSPPAPSVGEGDAGAFKQAMDAVANDDQTPAPADAPTAPKKGFLNTAKLAAANAAVTETDAEVAGAVAAPTPPAAAVAPAPVADDAGEPVDAAASDETAPAADAAVSDTAAAAPPVAPPVAPPAPVAQAAAPPADGETKSVSADDVSTVGRALGTIDRILNENGVRIDGEASPERLQAVKAAVDQVMAKAPPQVRAKLETLFARVLQTGADAAQTAPASEEAAAPDAQTEAEAAQAQAQAEAARAAETLKAIQTALNGGQTRRPTPASVMRDFAAANAAEAPTLTPRLADPRQEAAREAPAAPTDAAKPSGGVDASPSPNAASTPSATASTKAEPAREPAAAATAQADPTVNPTAPADTAAGAPAAHAGSHAVVAEAVRGSPETVAHLSAEILKKLGERSTRFDVELHPADMGRVDVRLTIEADGRLKAQMAFDNPVAAADLRARSDELRRSLEQAGFQVSEDSFSFADRNSDGGRSFEDARQQFAEGGRARARAFRAGEQAASLADAPPVARRAVRLGVDVRI